MAVAMVFVGHARTFHLPRVSGSIRTNFIDRLCPDADVFWYFSEPPQWSQEVNQSLMALFQPVKIAIHNEIDEDWAAPCAEPPLPTMTGVSQRFKFFAEPTQAIRSARTQLTKFRRALDLVHGYDWIIRLRFDAGWYKPFPVKLEDLEDAIYVPIQTWNGINDQVAIVPGHLAKDYFHASDIFECDNTTGLPRWFSREMVWQPETLLWAHLRSRKATVRRMTMPVAVTRETDSRCFEAGPYALLGTLVDAVSRPIQRYQALAKTAHVAACAAQFPCCQVDVKVQNDFFFHVGIHDRSSLDSECRKFGIDLPTCETIRSQLRRHAVLADDASVAEDMDALKRQVDATVSHQQVAVQINSAPPPRRDGGEHTALTARDAATFATTLLVDTRDAADLWRGLLCLYYDYWPRAEVLGPSVLCDHDTLTYVAAAEMWLHAAVDDIALTDPSYDSLITNQLGWQIWSLDHVPTTYRTFPSRRDLLLLGRRRPQRGDSLDNAKHDEASTVAPL